MYFTGYRCVQACCWTRRIHGPPSLAWRRLCTPRATSVLRCMGPPSRNSTESRITSYLSSAQHAAVLGLQRQQECVLAAAADAAAAGENPPAGCCITTSASMPMRGLTHPSNPQQDRSVETSSAPSSAHRNLGSCSCRTSELAVKDRCSVSFGLRSAMSGAT